MATVTIYYLEMKSSECLIAKPELSDLRIVENGDKQFYTHKSLYQQVGSAWNWTDKNSWTDSQWRDYAENKDHRLWIAYYQNATAGYFELNIQAEGDVEIAYFGLLAQFIGKGLGAALLSQAVKTAWAWPETRRVWVHTCTDDHPNALRNYEACGMKVYKVEQKNNSSV